MGLYCQLQMWGARGIGVFVFSMSIPLLVTYPFFKLGGLGAGDVKLLSVCAGYLIPSKAGMFLLISFIIGAILSLLKMCQKRILIQRLNYLYEYVKKICIGEGIGPYEVGVSTQERQIHMAGAVAVSVMLYMGGVY